MNNVKKVALALAGALVLAAGPVLADKPDLPPGQLMKAASSAAVYYLDADGRRHVFPNQHIFMSWYDGFGQVINLSDADISQYPLGSAVPYKAGKRLIKLLTDPKVYAVDDGGILRWVRSEAAARALYGKNWNQFVDDLPDSFFANYVLGQDIDGSEDFDAEQGERESEPGDALEVAANRVTVCHRRGKKGFHTIHVAQAARSAHLAHGDTEGRCASESSDDDEDENEDGDTTAPTISGLSVTGLTDVSALVSWTTNEPSSYALYFDTDSSTVAAAPYEASSVPATVTVVSSSAETVDHQVTLSGLTASTTYYFRLVASDGSDNSAQSAVQSFQTTVTPDTTAPVISGLNVFDLTASTASIGWATDEPASFSLYYDTDSTVVTNAPYADSSAAPTLTVVSQTGFLTSRTVGLSGLTPATTYYFKVEATDPSGNVSVSPVGSFLTSSL